MIPWALPKCPRRGPSTGVGRHDGPNDTRGSGPMPPSSLETSIFWLGYPMSSSNRSLSVPFVRSRRSLSGRRQERPRWHVKYLNLKGFGFATALDARRGFGHGAFVPLMLAWPWGRAAAGDFVPSASSPNSQFKGAMENRRPRAWSWRIVRSRCTRTFSDSWERSSTTNTGWIALLVKEDSG